jgi:hypothetical protein
MSVVIFKTRSLYAWGKNPRYLWASELKEKSLIPAGIKPVFFTFNPLT